MACGTRIQSADACYHVMALGKRREDIFHDDDRRLFLHTLGQACEMTGWRRLGCRADPRQRASMAAIWTGCKGADPRKGLLADLMWRRKVVSR